MDKDKIQQTLKIEECNRKIEEEYKKRLAEIIKLSETDLENSSSIKEDTVKSIKVKRAYCPKCNNELISKIPKMFNPFTQEAQCIHVCTNTECNAKYNLEYSYPRIVFYDENNEEIFAHCE